MSTSVLIAVSAFLVVTFFTGIVLTMITEKGKYEKRVSKYLPIKKEEEKKKKNREGVFVKKISESMERAIHFSKYETILTQSGLKMTQGELFIWRVIGACVVVGIGYLYEFHFLLLILCGIIGFYLPILYIKRKRKLRLKKCSEQLGNALGTMANALRAGFSFMQAMKMVAEEIEDPLGPEFLNTLKEINYGVKIEDAFDNLLKRLPDRELEMVLTTLLIQRSSGGNLAYLLETMQETIIDRSRVQDEVKTLTAQGKMSSVIITLLPPALALYLTLVNPEYFNMLFSHPLGWGMLIVGGINMILGWLFINKIVHIEV
ncbi:type II secretion system F family protein [Fredinandcohnia onubensis]|uniref:type II secretion system F family protein n=1 Tax=Fredinandcohnia onubensis TaxID=1571209 RepID=UPI000C0BE040|nr:type II secretion system F family protein [Fredinandcohnia onubensis]